MIAPYITWRNTSRSPFQSAFCLFQTSIFFKNMPLFTNHTYLCPRNIHNVKLKEKNSSVFSLIQTKLNT